MNTLSPEMRRLIDRAWSVRRRYQHNREEVPAWSVTEEVYKRMRMELRGELTGDAPMRYAVVGPDGVGSPDVMDDSVPMVLFGRPIIVIPTGAERLELA